MENTPATISAYQANYDLLLKGLNGGNDSQRIATRDRAMSFFKEKGFPGTKDETWRFTDIRPIISQAFEMSPPVEANVDIEAKINDLLFLDWNGLQLVFIDGHFQRKFSVLDQPFLNNVIVNDLRTLSKDRQRQLNEVIENSPAKNDNAFTALNTAFFDDGLWVDIPANIEEKLHIHLLHFSTANKKNSASFPRHFIRVGSGSRLYLTESYAGNSDQVYFSNIVTDIELAENAMLNHYKIQAEGQTAYHLSHTYVHQQKHSNYQSCSVSSGAAITRGHICVTLEGEHCETGLNGLYLGHNQQLIDNQTFIDHTMPHCHSHELYRGILTDEAKGVFSGKIMVRPDARKTDAEQRNNCLLLSENAKIDTKPQLEIYADDVKCTHGATVGQLDEEAMFYMQSRGIGEQKARNMLIYSFAEEIIENIDDKQVNERIEQLILNRLEQDMHFHKNGAV